ncbi:uncharacterized protein L203_100230 [Cryptococcus depauperatus CBS 7841]|uniref:Uncharacterized protein n=1 Tax=Cryptococcus depauperatus CBS 7841 TaxID=1295531 RepID=A0A1E3IZF4_9TREE|nr:hypothetical protein L203_00110 [Cryptococcus depauperatus CBS 7841]
MIMHLAAILSLLAVTQISALPYKNCMNHKHHNHAVIANKTGGMESMASTSVQDTTSVQDSTSVINSIYSSTTVTTSSDVVTTTSTESNKKVEPSTSEWTSTSATTTSEASTSKASSSSLEQTMIDMHNKARAEHNAGEVTWDAKLAEYAANAASSCVFEHTGGPYGENLAAGAGGDYNAASGFNAWYDEASEYDPQNPVYSHFTQVVWKGSTTIGCALHTCAGNTIFKGSDMDAEYLVCEYYPPGNVIGQFDTQVSA